MAGLVERVLGVRALRSAARGASNWIDLQWSLLIEQLTRVAPLAHGRLLDVGCGEKPYEHIFRPYVDSYVGVEHEATFALTASSARGRPDVLYDGKTLPFEDASFDTVLSVQVLEHTPTPGELVREMGRVLRPDGILILSAPFSFRLHEEPHDYFRYSPHGLSVLCKGAGLEVTEVSPTGSLWSVLAHKLNTYLALHVAGLDGITQALGKLGHEGPRNKHPRWWTVPLVVPTMGAMSAAARVLDRIAPDETEALSYLILARHAP